MPQQVVRHRTFNGNDSPPVGLRFRLRRPRGVPEFVRCGRVPPRHSIARREPPVSHPTLPSLQPGRTSTSAWPAASSGRQTTTGPSFSTRDPRRVPCVRPPDRPGPLASIPPKDARDAVDPPHFECCISVAAVRPSDWSQLQYRRGKFRRTVSTVTRHLGGRRWKLRSALSAR